MSEAPNMRLQTYRARGRINPHRSPSGHIEGISQEKNSVAQKEKLSQKKLKKPKHMAREYIQHKRNTNKSYLEKEVQA